MPTTPQQALDRLGQLARSGELASFCRQHGIDLLVAFGSVADPGTLAAIRDRAMVLRMDTDWLRPPRPRPHGLAMSSQPLRPERVHASLARLRELVGDLDAFVGEPSPAELRSDRARRHIAERVLTQLVEIAVSVNSHIAAVRLGKAPADYRESFDLAAEAGALPESLAADLRDAAGLRNVLVHEYVDVDLTVVAAAVVQARDGFAAYVREIARFLQGQAG